jgi:hypothetical protein
MKIEILLCESINEKCTNMTCFEASEYVKKTIVNQKSIQGVVLIDNTSVKFNFSPMGIDGDIFTDVEEYRLIVKYLLPLYVFNNMKSAV